MGIAYLITIVILSIMFFLLKKYDKQINALVWGTITVLLILCYNVFICYVLSLFRIECNLMVLSLINLIVSILIGIKIKKDGEIQKYEIKINDILFAILLFLIVIIVTFINFGLPFNIKYETEDPAFHYLASLEFYKNSTLLNYVEPGQIFNFQTFMPAAYVNTGLLFKAFSSFMTEMDFYKIFIAFDIFTLYLGGMLFFSLLLKKFKKSSTYLIGIIFTLIYTLGYPFNSLIFGFEYLNFGINTIIAILILAPYLKDNGFKNIYIVAIIALLTFSLFFSYYLFIPLVFMALGIYMLIYMIKDSIGKGIIGLFAKKNVLSVLAIFVFPTILGLSYFILPTLLKGEQTTLSAINTEGYTYSNLYGNFIMFMPLSIYYICECIRRKSFSIEFIIFIFTIIYSILFFTLGMFGIISAYYFYKIYYILWGLILYATFSAICNIEKNYEMKIFAYIFVVVYIGIIMYTILSIDEKINMRASYFASSDMMSAVVGIDVYNKNKAISNYSVFSNEEIDILKYYNKLENKNSVEVYGSKEQQFWIYAILGISNHTSKKEFNKKQILSIDNWFSKETKYMLYFKNGNEFETIKDSSQYSIVYQNELGGILERK